MWQAWQVEIKQKLNDSKTFQIKHIKLILFTFNEYKIENQERTIIIKIIIIKIYPQATINKRITIKNDAKYGKRVDCFNHLLTFYL